MASDEQDLRQPSPLKDVESRTSDGTATSPYSFIVPPSVATYEDGLAEGKRLAVDIRNALAGLLLEWDWGRIFSATGQRDDNAMKAMKAIARAREALGNYDLAAATMNVPLQPPAQVHNPPQRKP